MYNINIDLNTKKGASASYNKAIAVKKEIGFNKKMTQKIIIRDFKDTPFSTPEYWMKNNTCKS